MMIKKIVVVGLKGVALLMIPFWLFVIYQAEITNIAAGETIAEGEGEATALAELRYDAANDGTLVYGQGIALSAGPIADPVTGLKVEGYALVRTVEVHQWKLRYRRKYERKREIISVWSDTPLSSEKLPSEYQNPEKFPFSSAEYRTPGITLGPFTIAPPLAGILYKTKEYGLSDKEVKKIGKKLGKPVTLHEGALYVGKGDPVNDPKVGDMKISYALAGAPVTVSVIALQGADKSLKPLVGKSGKELAVLWKGEHSQEELWGKEKMKKGASFYFQWLFALFVMVISFRVLLGRIADPEDGGGFLSRIGQFGAWRFSGGVTVGAMAVTYAAAGFSSAPAPKVVALLAGAIILGLIARRIGSDPSVNPDRL